MLYFCWKGWKNNLKLNHECIRDLLLYIEENLTYNDELEINKISLNNYSLEELLYTTEKLVEADYLTCYTIEIDDEYSILLVQSITYKGHHFLDTVRDNKVWSKTKNILSFLKSVSIEITSETASKVINHLIDKNFNL